MYEQYAIGVRVGIENQLSGPLAAIVAELNKADKAAKAMDKSLANIGGHSSRINATADAVRNLNRQLSIGEGRAARMAAAMREMAGMRPPRGDWSGGGFGPSSGGGGNRGQSGVGTGGSSSAFYPMAAFAAGGAAARYSAQVGAQPFYPMAGGAGQGGGLPPWYTPPIGLPHQPGGGSAGTAGTAGAAVLEGQWSRVGGGGGGGGIPPSQGPGQRRPRHGGSPHDAMFAGGLLAYGGAHAIMGPLDAASDYQTEAARFAGLGLGDKLNKEADAFVKGMRTFGTSMAENMALFRDAQTVFRDSGNLHHAEMVTPMMARMRFANEALYGGERAGAMEGKFLDMLKVIELRRGLNSPEEFQRQANMIQQVLTTSGGRVDATQYLNMLKTGGVAAKSLSNQAAYYQMEPLIQEMGGMRVGTGLMSAYSNLALGRTTTQVAKELDRLGLIADKSKVEYNKIGMIKRIMPGAIKGGDMLAESPIDYLEKVLLPAFSRKGITDEKKILQEIGLIFSNRTASQLFSTMYLQRGNIRNSEQMSAQALNIDQASKLAGGTLTGQQIEVQKKWNDALNHAGTVILPIATQALNGLSRGLSGVSDWAQEHPNLFGPLIKGLGGLAIAGTVAGGVLLFGGAVSMVGGALGGGSVVAGLTSVASALGVLSSAAAGFMAGSWINNNVISPGMKALTGDESLGGWVYDKTHPLGAHQGQGMGPHPKDKPATGGSGYQPEQMGPPRPTGGTPSHSSLNTIAPRYQNLASAGDIYLDGHKVGKHLVRYIASRMGREASRPQGGTGRFDDSLDLLSPALA